MSESSFPFEGQPVATASTATEPVSRDGSRTKLIATGGVVVVLVLGLLAYFVVFAGGDEAVEDVVVAPRPAAAALSVPEAAAGPVKQERLSAKSFGRDPFEALIVESVAAVAPIVTSTTPTPVTVPTVAGGGNSVPSPVTDSPASSQAHTFRVMAVAPDNGSVDVKVDGKLFKNLQAGEVFGTYFQVVLISGQVNSFQYGEEKFNVIGTKRLTIA